MKFMNLKKLSLGAFSVGSLLTAGSTYAVSFGDMGRNIADNSMGMTEGLYAAGLLIGVALVIGALIGFATHKKTNTPLSYSVIAFVAGVLLTSVTAFIGTGSETAFGSDVNDIGNIGL